jgi:hypothetical protein
VAGDVASQRWCHPCVPWWLWAVEHEVVVIVDGGGLRRKTFAC